MRLITSILGSDVAIESGNKFMVKQLPLKLVISIFNTEWSQIRILSSDSKVKRALHQEVEGIGFRKAKFKVVHNFPMNCNTKAFHPGTGDL